MKILILLLILPLTIFGQIPVNSFGEAEISKVYEVAGSAEDLQTKAREAIYRLFASGSHVIQYETHDKIVCKTLTKELSYKNGLAGYVEAGRFYYLLTLEFKDNRYRMTADKIKYHAGKMDLPAGADLAEDYPSNWGNFGKRQKQREWERMQEEAYNDIKTTMAVIDLRISEAAVNNSDW